MITFPQVAVRKSVLETDVLCEALLDQRAVHGCVRSTLRNYQGSVRQFCDFLTNPAYGWSDECLRHFGTHPVQVVYDWNAATHAGEAEGEPERRAFTKPELEQFFDHADEEVLRVRGMGRKGWLPAFRDAALFKVAYAYGLRRNETRMLDLTDFGRNPEGREFGEFGTLLVRYGKAKKGSPPKRSSVLTVWHWTPVTIEEWISEVRPGMRHSISRALWPSERGPRVGVQRLDSRFAAYRDAIGLDPALEFYSLRRSHITHLIEDGHDPLFVQQQVGHDHASTTAIYTCVSSAFRTRSLRRVLDATIRQLVLQAPAPVIAKALGYHDKTATRLVTEAGGTWSRYAPGDHTR